MLMKVSKLFTIYIERKGWECPCHHFEDVFLEKGEEVPEGFMVKVAWKMIRGWKKDNKE